MNSQLSEDFFILPTTDEEFKFISEYANGRPKEDFPIPSELRLPLEYIQLLKYSNGGGMINGEREFGYFTPETIREMYFGYGFLIWAPKILPIAFNGGGKFYTYDFRDNFKSPSIYLVPSGCIGDDENCIFLGNTLDEVLSKTTNVEEELDILYQRPEQTEKEIRVIEIYEELKKLKDCKEKGIIDLKSYLQTKRILETEINELNI